MEVSVDRAGILPGPGEPVAPILSPLGRKEWRWQLQILLTPKAASKCPKDSQDLKGGGVREFSRSTSGLGVTPYWPRVAGVWSGTEPEAGGQGPTSLYRITESKLKPRKRKGLVMAT